MNLRKTLIYGMLLSFALALYQVMFQPAWNSWLESMGRDVGIAEVATGYFVTWVVTMFIGKVVTRKMGGE